MATTTSTGNWRKAGRGWNGAGKVRNGVGAERRACWAWSQAVSVAVTYATILAHFSVAIPQARPTWTCTSYRTSTALSRPGSLASELFSACSAPEAGAIMCPQHCRTAQCFARSLDPALGIAPFSCYVRQDQEVHALWNPGFQSKDQPWI